MLDFSWRQNGTSIKAQITQQGNICVTMKNAETVESFILPAGEAKRLAVWLDRVGQDDTYGLVMAILRVVAEKEKIEVDDLISDTKKHFIAHARYRAMYLIYKNTKLSTPKTGRIFAKHHVTVLNALKAVEKEIKEKPECGARYRRWFEQAQKNRAPQKGAKTTKKFNHEGHEGHEEEEEKY